MPSAKSSLRQTTDLPATTKSIFKKTSSSTFGSVKEHNGIEPEWSDFILLYLFMSSVIHEAHETLPELPKKQEADWVSDELGNLSMK